MTKSEVQAILDNADTNNDGKLDYNEVIYMIKLLWLNDNYIHVAFCCKVNKSVLLVTLYT